MTIERFTYRPQPIEVFFGNDRSLEVSDMLETHGVRRALVLSTDTPRAKRLAERVGNSLGDRLAGYFDACVEQVPVEIARKAQAMAASLKVDSVVSVGGGSTIGFGKAIALTSKVKVFHVVTTYSGSEMTASQGMVEGGVKQIVTDQRMLATGVIYDPTLTVSLPPHVSGPSGMNAMAHCVEALYGAQSTPISTLMATSGIRALAEGLPQVVADPDNLEARSDDLYGAYMSGIAINAGVALHHHVAHVLGGSFGVPHALAHTVALPHTIAYNRRAVPQAMSQLAEALRCEEGPQGIYDLSLALGIDMALERYGFGRADIPRAVTLIVEHARPNPQPLDPAGLTTMFEAMVEGRRPIR